jgi:hypothetical protein
MKAARAVLTAVNLSELLTFWVVLKWQKPLNEYNTGNNYRVVLSWLSLVAPLLLGNLLPLYKK